MEVPVVAHCFQIPFLPVQRCIYVYVGVIVNVYTCECLDPHKHVFMHVLLYMNVCVHVYKHTCTHCILSFHLTLLCWLCFKSCGIVSQKWHTVKAFNGHTFHFPSEVV